MKVSNTLKAKRLLSRNLIPWLLIAPCLFCFTFFVWRPTLVGMLNSFFELRGFERFRFVGLENYKIILSNTLFLKTLANTVKYVLWYVVFGYAPPIIVAILLSELRTFRKTFRFAVYIPTLIPGIVSIMMWKFMFKPDMTGLLNGVLGAVGIDPLLWLNSKAMVIPAIVFTSAWHGLGGNMLYYFSAVQGVNSELYEAAVIDGAGVFKRVWHVTIPQISGVMLLMFVRAIIGVFQVMEAPLVMTDGGPDGASLTLGLQAYRYAFENFQISYSLALGVVEFLMLIGLTVLYFKMQKRIETE